MTSHWKKLFIRKNCDVPTFCGVLEHAYLQIWRQTGKRQEYLFGHFKDKHFTYYLRGVDERLIGRKLYRKYFVRPAQIVSAYTRGIRFLSTTNTKTIKWKQVLTHPRANHIRELSRAFVEFRKDLSFVNLHYSIMPWWALEAWQHDFEDSIGKLIRKRGLQDRYDVLMASIFRPWKITAIGNVGRALARRTPVQQLVKKYQFLRSWTLVWYRPITAGWIRSTAQYSGGKDFPLLSKQKLFTLLQPSVHDKKYLDMASYAIFFKDWRDDLRREHAYRWIFLFEAIAKYFSISYTDIGYLTLDEIAEALKKDSLDARRISRRKGHEFIMTVTPQLKMKILSPVPGRYKKSIREAETMSRRAEIRGIIAQPGIVTGPVKVVRNFHDIKRVERGDVLVTNTTHPNYLQGMKKAVAFVTDEGGIASHAAIVAREFKKPCIVGTKIATKIFKDGDRIEVDATRGIVRKLT